MTGMAGNASAKPSGCHKRQQQRQQQQHKAWRKVLWALCCVTAFCTVYALITPAITMSNTPYCDIEDHTHSLACFSNPKADVETAADWEKTVEDVELTGNHAADLLQIAQTQLGYAESEENYAVDTDPDTGAETAKGYTRYGDWYGDAYGNWCAMYVSFCLNYADISAEDFPREASCPNWVKLLQSENWKLYHSVEEGYTPPIPVTWCFLTRIKMEKPTT